LAPLSYPGKKTPGESEKIGKMRSQSQPVALFGATTLSLLLGRACCLADRPPVGLYDPDWQSALRGALYLGVSAREKPAQLCPFEIAIVGHQEGLDALRGLSHQPSLVLSLFQGRPHSDPNLCQAITDSPLADSSIAAEIPDLTFRLEGPAKGRAQAFLESLSQNLKFVQAL
jgi:hypothetical protein